MKKERSTDPRALELQAFCRNGDSLQGAWPLVAMARLAESLAAVPDGNADWSAQGQVAGVTGAEPELWLQLDAHADVPLVCQRCLQPMLERLVVARRFRFVRDEDEAARLDEELEDDVLPLQPRLDLQALLEDELILTLPLVPRHAVCPEPLPLLLDEESGFEDEPAPHPFAALAALRGRETGGNSGGSSGGSSGSA